MMSSSLYAYVLLSLTFSASVSNMGRITGYKPPEQQLRGLSVILNKESLRPNKY